MRAARTFEPELDKIAQARLFTRRTLDSWGVPADDVVLLVSELATNAVLHARTPYQVCIELDAESVELRVADENPRAPVLPAEDSQGGATSGRGLLMIGVLSDRWGIEKWGDHGKVVWAEKHLPPGTEAHGQDSEQPSRG